MRECSLCCDGPLPLPYLSSVETAVGVTHALAVSNTSLEGSRQAKLTLAEEENKNKSELAFKDLAVTFAKTCQEYSVSACCLLN